VNGKLTSSFRFFCLLLAGLLVGYYFPWLIGQRSYYQSDLTYYFEPFSRFIADGYSRGQLPLWNPYLYCGMAQAAVPSPGLFYPPMLLFVVLEFSQALAAFMALHQLIAGCGAYLLVVSLGWGALAAAVCGFAVGMSGYMFSLTANYTLVATAAWFPLLLFFLRSIDPAFTRTNVFRIFGGSVCMFGMIAAGRPEIFVPASLLAGGYIAVTAFGAYREDRMPRQALTQAGLRILSLTSGCLFALPVILPAAEWLRLSPRSNGLELKWVLMWSANWYDCLNMVAAQPLGDLTLLGSKYLNLVATRLNSLPYITSCYVGPVVFTLACWSLFDKNWRWRFVVLGVGASALIMALGQFTPIAPAICNLSPALASFRYPVKLLIFPALVLALMAARGASLAMDKEVPLAAQKTTAVIWSIVLLTGIVFLVAPQLHLLTAKFPWLVGKFVNFELMKDAQSLFGKSIAVTGGLGLLVSANYLAYTSGQLTKELFAFLTGSTLLLTLIMPAVAYQRHGTISDFYRRPNVLAEKLRVAVKGQGPQRFASRAQTFYHDPLTPSKEFLKRENIDFQEGFYLFTRDLMLPNTNVDFKIPYAFGYEAAEEGFCKELYSQALSTSGQNIKREAHVPGNDVPLARFCQISSVSHGLTQSYFGDRPQNVTPLDKDVFSLVEDNKENNYRIYATKRFDPRTYFATNIRWNATKKEFKARMLDLKRRDLLDECYVQGANDASVASGAEVDRGDRIEFVRDENERVTLTVETTQTRLLVLTDRLYPGWIATIDGQRTEIRLVNFFARGVVVPAGRHSVDFEYSPIAVWTGLAGAAATLLLLAVAFVFARADGRKKLPADARDLD